MQLQIATIALFSLLPGALAAPAAASASKAPAAASKAPAAASKAGASVKASAAAGAASATASAAPPPVGMSQPAAQAMMPGGQIPSDAQTLSAVMLWMNDTGKVSNFLNTASSLTGDDFTQQATIALNSEKDELNHKMVLDAAYGTTDVVNSANDTLATQGTFQAVVDALQVMVDQGPDTAQAMVDAINQNRCVNVLPNIDAYFSAAGQPDMKSVQPTGCLEVNAAVASGSVDASAAATSAPTAAPAAAQGAASSKTSSAKKAAAATTTAAVKAAGSAAASAAGSKAAAPAKASAAAKAAKKGN